MNILKRMFLTFLLFLLSVFIGCSGSGTLTSALIGDGIVAGTVVVKNSEDNSGVVISLEPAGSSSGILAAAERYTRQERAAEGFISSLSRKLASESDAALKATSTTDGNFTISKVPSGTYYVRAYKTNYVQNSTPNVDVKAEEVSTVNVELDAPGNLYGRILLEGESGYGGVICYLKNNGFVITDDAGDFVFNSLTEGTYELTIKEYGFQTVQKIVSIEKGKARNLGEIVLAKLSSQYDYGGIAGEVRSQNQAALGSVEVSIAELAQFKEYTNASGQFLIQNIPPGKYTVVLEYRYWKTSIANVYVQSKQHTRIDPVYFDITKPGLGIVRGQLTPVAPSMVSVQQANVEVTSKIVNGGDFSFSLPEGNYDLVVISAGYMTNSDAKGLIVTKGETTTIDIRLKPAPANLRGTVRDSQGNAIEGATVSTGTNYKAESGNTGAFVLSGIEPGTYTLTVAKRGYQQKAVANIALISGEDKDIGNVQLDKLPRNSVVATLSLEYIPGRMAVADSLLYVTDPAHDRIYFYDRVTLNEIGSLQTGRNPQHLVIDDNYIYVACKWSNSIGIYRRNNGTLYREIATGTYPVGLFLDESELLVANYGANTVSRVDLSSYQVTGSLDTGNGPVAVSKINGKLYILCQLSQNLEV
ncbi:MAG: carboxypeptidase regulatory-like domain-containing protein, partial [Candidatus Wallbacteria bacterium]|nr:carboxypeptidase regulatory-like domain-containing protein [Candidatus Wallbacteria bacterium]